MTALEPCSRQPKHLDAGIFQAEISSFALRLAAEGKAAKTIRTYTEAVQWFAAGRLPGRASWEHVDRQDIQQWMVWLLDRYSDACASNQYRALQQFFKWLAAEDELPDPMQGLMPPPVTQKLVPVFTGEELTRLEQACAGRSFAQRRDTAIIAVFQATGIRLAELTGLRYDPSDPGCSDVDLWQREITVRGKGGKDRIVRIGHHAARSLDRYLRARSRHAQAWRPQLWLGAGNREPLTAAGIYQMITRRGRQCGVDAYPHRFRHHFSHTWLDRCDGRLHDAARVRPRRGHSQEQDQQADAGHGYAGYRDSADACCRDVADLKARCAGGHDLQGARRHRWIQRHAGR
jgi:integrase/recombinase XerD